jgi:hypothetical protein
VRAHAGVVHYELTNVRLALPPEDTSHNTGTSTRPNPTRQERRSVHSTAIGYDLEHELSERLQTIEALSGAYVLVRSCLEVRIPCGQRQSNAASAATRSLPGTRTDG